MKFFESVARNSTPLTNHEISKSGASTLYKEKTVKSYLFLKGEGILKIDGKQVSVKAGEVAQIPAGKEHQILNQKETKLEFYRI